MIKTPLSTVIGGAFWTPNCTILGSTSKTLNQIIKSLFANGEQGFAYDPNDLSTMWQDQAKLLPVTGEGQPVWHILDKSGNNNHAFATSSATRPILRKNATTGAYYLGFDGSDDFLQTSNIDFTVVDEMTVITSIRGIGTTLNSIVIESSPSGFATNGSFGVRYPGNIGNTATFTSKGTTYAQVNAGSNLIPPQSLVLTGSSNISTNVVSIRANGTAYSEAVTQGAGNYGNHPIYIGRRAGTSLPFNGHLYSLIGIGRLTTGVETAALEKLIAKNTGVTLSV